VIDGEQGVLNVLGDQGTATIRRVTDILYAEGTPGQYATAQKHPERLKARGYVARDHISLERPVASRDSAAPNRTPLQERLGAPVQPGGACPPSSTSRQKADVPRYEAR